MARLASQRNLDRIIRPLVNAEFNWSKPGRAPKVVKPEEPPKLVIGFGGALVFDTSTQSSVTAQGVYGNTRRGEVEREYDVIRVSSEENPDSYVDVESVTKITHGVLAEGNYVKQNEMKYAPSQEQPNARIISTGNVRRAPGA